MFGMETTELIYQIYVLHLYSKQCLIASPTQQLVLLSALTNNSVSKICLRSVYQRNQGKSVSDRTLMFEYTFCTAFMNIPGRKIHFIKNKLFNIFKTLLKDFNSGV